METTAVEVTLKHPVKTGMWFGVGLILAPLMLVMIGALFTAIIAVISI